jgi:argininosuccinate lyase
VPSRLAHEAVGKAVALAVERGCDLQKLPLADLQAIHASFDAAFHSCLGLTEVLALHDVPGGTSPRQARSAECSGAGCGIAVSGTNRDPLVFGLEDHGLKIKP